MARVRDYRAEYAARVARGAVKRGRDYDAAARAATAARRVEQAAAKAARAAAKQAAAAARAAAKAAKAKTPRSKPARPARPGKSTRPVKIPGAEGISSTSGRDLAGEVRKAKAAGQGVNVTAWSRQHQKWVSITPRIAFGALGPDLEGAPGAGRSRRPSPKKAPSIVRVPGGAWRDEDLDLLADLIDEYNAAVLDGLADASGDGSA